MSIYATDSNGNIKKVMQIFHNDGTSIKEIKEMYTNYNGTIQKVFSKNNRQYNNVNYIVKVSGEEDIDITNNINLLGNICLANNNKGNRTVIIESDFIIKNNDSIYVSTNFQMSGPGASKVKIKLFMGDYTYNTGKDDINVTTEGKIICENDNTLSSTYPQKSLSNNVKVSDIGNINDKKLKIYIFIEDPGDTGSNSRLTSLTIIINDQIRFEY